MKIPGKSINYEYDFEPETGEAIAILSGLKWLRLPLPFLLGHINVWLLQDGDGWAIVDTGIFTNATQEVSGIRLQRVSGKRPDHARCTCSRWMRL